MSDNKPYMTVDEAKNYTQDRQLEWYPKDVVVSACREIIRLNEVMEGMKKEKEMWQARSEARDATIRRFYKRYNHLDKDSKHIIDEMDSESYCDKCGSWLQPVRPGKWQCPECE